MPRCSVIIPVFNRSSLTRRCLETILAQPISTMYELIVVDDASTDDTAARLDSFGSAIRVVAHETNTGFARSCNDGAAVATGEYLVLLNNDTVPRAGWLDSLVQYADAHPQAAIVGSKLLFPDGTVQHAGVVICQDLHPRHVYAGFPGDHPVVCRSRRYQIVTGACALIRRAVFEELGGLDEAYLNGYEDVDLCLRAGSIGHEIHYCHESTLDHLESASRDRSLDNDRNGRLYLDRWGPRVRPDDLETFVADGLIELTYTELYPLRFSISPELGTADNGEASSQRIAQLVTERSRKLYRLLAENIRLTVEAEERQSRGDP
jgi:GT2 family glycosyltransferase